MAKRGPRSGDGLRGVAWQRFLRAPDCHLLDGLYVPALTRAVRYDRCCAYFSSHVLAVAARGFGGFIQTLRDMGEQAPHPSARLLVNEQLDADDLEALLASGDDGALAGRLLARLVTPQAALEKNRLQMLAWLVASGLLEVRVGLMRNTLGVCHAKFGLVTDAAGDVLAFMGSDNETGAAVLENYEELELRTSWDDGEFTSYYAGRFAHLWDDLDEHVHTVPLPEAVRLKLIRLAPKQPPTELRQDKHGLSTAMLWHFIAASPYLPNGAAACDATAMVDLWPHQRNVVEDTAAAFPSGRLLCDEVGMGKTIEAVAVLRRLLAGRGVKRALLLVPAGLLAQWQDELREKGGLVAPRWEKSQLTWPDGRREQVSPAQALAENDVLLLSREWARLEGNRQVVLTAPAWDLVLLDEAHAARRREPKESGFNSANLLLSLMRDLQLRGQTRGILLLSATPMQTQPWEPWDLLAVLGIGGAWQVDFQDIRTYYGGLSKLAAGSMDLKTATRMAVLVGTDAAFPDPPLGLGGAATLGNRLATALPGDQRRYGKWLRAGSPLGRCMHRNTRGTLRKYFERGLLAAPPPSREPQDVVYDFEQQSERACYDAVAGYINERFDQLESEQHGKGFVMTIYRRRASSSPQALMRSLERRRDQCETVIRHQSLPDFLSLDDYQVDVQDLSDSGVDERIDLGLPRTPAAATREKDTINALLAQLAALAGADSKLDRFWRLLREFTDEGRSVLVFTEYTDTMEYLRDRLHPDYGSTLGCYCGGGGQVYEGREWRSVAKPEITDRLADKRLRVLICTDAASEGLNLQTASALVNYDLPWNPSKVEQRIGRIDRIGQQSALLPIRNLFLTDSVDVSVYRALRERCGLFEHFVGPMQPVLALARDAFRDDLRPADLPALLARIQQAAEAASRDETVLAAFKESLPAEVPEVEPPVSRQSLTAALHSLGAGQGVVNAKLTKSGTSWRLTGVGKKAVHVSLDRESLERDPSLEPLTVVSPVVTAIADHLEWPEASTPLVLARAVAGVSRCTEARWLGSDGTVVVTSAAQLTQLVEEWDGSPPDPAALTQAQKEAQRAATSRAAAQQAQAKVREEAGLAGQVEAARRRLLRELARTLRCLGPGGFGALLHGQLQREGVADGRYHRAVARLGGMPQWPGDVVSDADRYVGTLRGQALQFRLNLASELDAALNDPRWQALRGA